MSANPMFGSPRPPLEARHRHQRPRPYGEDRDDRGEERDRPYLGDFDGHRRHDETRPRKHGRHGCDRVRRQGARRQID